MGVGFNPNNVSFYATNRLIGKQSGNPIKQDVKKGNLRFVHDVYPHTGYIWNYGAFPQVFFFHFE